MPECDMFYCAGIKPEKKCNLEKPQCVLYAPQAKINIFQTIFWMDRPRKSFRNKMFMLDETTYQNTSKWAIFLEYENPCSFFVFQFVHFML